MLAQATVSTYVIGVGYWLLFLVIGVSLLRDIARDFGVSLPVLLNDEERN
jgi:hypothetical protein